jgi:sugar lactone lactonase YvrE
MMKKIKYLLLLPVAAMLAISCASGDDDDDAASGDTNIPVLDFPVEAEVFLQTSLGQSEGISFNSEGRLFVGTAEAIYEVLGDGSSVLVNDTVAHPIGLAPATDGDIFVCDFGPRQWPGDDDVADGTIVRLSPSGTTEVWGTGIPDPNFATVTPDGGILVSDDFREDIYLVPPGGGEAEVWYSGVAAPNGMVFSLDGATLFVAQTFETAGSMVADNRIWQIAVGEDGMPSGDATVLAELEVGATNDGMALDEYGFVYVAANMIGKIVRIDPDDGTTEVVAEDIDYVASLAFGRGGEFSETSIYATQLFGGNVWEIPVGVKGAPLY